MHSNEFSDFTLRGAIQKATAAYRREPAMEFKDRCSDLAFELADFKRAASDLLDKAEDLKRESENLKESARRAGINALIDAALAAAVGFGAAARALRKLRRLNPRDLTRNDWISLIPLVGGGFAAGFNAYNAVRDYQEAQKLAREAERAEAAAESVGEDIVRIANAYRRHGCGASAGVS